MAVDSELDEATLPAYLERMSNGMSDRMSETSDRPRESCCRDSVAKPRPLNINKKQTRKRAQRADQAWERAQLETLEQLTDENYRLQQRILRYRKHHCMGLDVMARTDDALDVIDVALGQSQMEKESLDDFLTRFHSRETQATAWI